MILEFQWTQYLSYVTTLLLYVLKKNLIQHSRAKCIKIGYHFIKDYRSWAIWIFKILRQKINWQIYLQNHWVVIGLVLLKAIHRVIDIQLNIFYHKLVVMNEFVFVLLLYPSICASFICKINRILFMLLYFIIHETNVSIIWGTPLLRHMIQRQ